MMGHLLPYIPEIAVSFGAEPHIADPLLAPKGIPANAAIDEFRRTEKMITARRRRDSLGQNREAGFTLVEMLVVLVIIGLLASLVAPKVFNQLADARAKTARIQIQNFTNALDMFYLDLSRYPTTVEGLNAIYEKPVNARVWNGPYLRGNSVPKDPWSNDYLYRSPGQGHPYEIVSLGSDGVEGGSGNAADITSSQE
jgi:general secretion pathway protein G